MLDFPFTYEEKIEGATVAEYEGRARVVSDSDNPHDEVWRILSLHLDGHVPNPRRAAELDGIIHEPLFKDVEVELPPKHPLATKILLTLLQGPQRDAINYAWASRPSAKAERRVFA